MTTPAMSALRDIVNGDPADATDVQWNFETLETYAGTLASAIDDSAVVTTAWTAVTYQNSWADYGGGYQGVSYRKIDDVVYLRGVMASGTESVAAFTLPAGFRPPATMLFTTMTAASVPCLVTLNTDGTYVPTFNSGFSLYYIVEHQFSVTA